MTQREQYLDYLEKHIGFVQAEAKKLGIEAIGKGHDKSKFSEEEFDAYKNKFYGEKTEDVEKAFKYAWNHHQKRNKHHWQYWVLLEDNGGVVPLDIPVTYIREMVADWTGAGLAISGANDCKVWYKQNKDKQTLTPRTRRLTEMLIFGKTIDPITHAEAVSDIEWIRESDKAEPKHIRKLINCYLGAKKV